MKRMADQPAVVPEASHPVEGVDEDLPLLVSHVLDLERLFGAEGSDAGHQLVERRRVPEEGVGLLDEEPTGSLGPRLTSYFIRRAGEI
jgi:hypothetical protein